MALYLTRQTTPPSSFGYLPESAHCRSLSTDASFYSSESSPDSVLTAITTPPRSPIRQHGPLLLPKIRSQDQTTEPAAGPVRHRRTMSTASAGYANCYAPYPQRPSVSRRATSPPETNSLCSPASVPATSPFDSAFGSALNSPITFPSQISSTQTRKTSITHTRSQSASNIKTQRSHSRSGSTSSVDDTIIARYGYPTYRNMPAYIPASSATTAAPTLSLMTAMPASFSHIDQVSQFSQMSTVSEITQAPLDPTLTQDVTFPLATELQYETFDQPTPTSSLMEYLSAPNPTPALVRRITTSGRGLNTYFWWDVRNLRSWSDFNMDTINAIPGLPELLQVPVPCTALPSPPRTNLQPDCESALHDIYRDYFATKVNAALKIAQGNTHMVMRACKQAPSSRQQPDFVSNYINDYEKTIYGDGRGRVVGLVKAYDQWNTGMRSEAPNKQVYYLQGLAHLHKMMRDNGCRYGFIMTEIELLCVRCGGPANAAEAAAANSNNPAATTVNGSQIPLFGYLELSQPIRLSAHGLDVESNESQMTAGLALWYLHMLAKESPLPGMGSWRMDVGGPAALTRQNILERDTWIPKPNLSEKREAKRLRGWVWPEEPLSRKETGRGKRARKA